MTSAATYIGLDLGTSGLKGVAIDGAGRVIARAGERYPTSRPAPQAAEQDLADWTTAVTRVTARLAADAPARTWRAIGLSGMIPTLVTIGDDGQPTGPAITWEDGRAESHADQLRHDAGAESLYRSTGQWVDGRYLLPMFLRLAAAEPDRAADARLLVGAKDYLFGWLTGVTCTDPSTATGFGCYELQAGDWDAGIIAAGSRQAKLPDLPLVVPASTTRPLQPEVADLLGCDEIPVCLGAADSVLGAFGLGVTEPGQIAYVAGTSTVIVGVSGRLVTDPQHRFLVTPLVAACSEQARWGLEMDLLATGSAVRWLADLLGDGLDERALHALAAAVPTAQAPVVLPYLSPGEQGALWNPRLRGTVAGLTFAHGRGHLARGLLNGVVLESRRCLAVLDQTGPFDQEIHVAGGGVEPSFLADLADVTGRRVITPAGSDTALSARGAAMLAARAVGQPVPVAAPATSAVIEPDPSKSQTWSALWARYEHLRRAVSEHYDEHHDEHGGQG